jgi:hypothetical protein
VVAFEVWRNNPGLHIVPAHDFDALKAIPLLAPATLMRILLRGW